MSESRTLERMVTDEHDAAKDAWDCTKSTDTMRTTARAEILKGKRK